MINLEAILVFGVLGFAPGLFWFWYFYRKDLEPEPIHLARNCFVLGVAATIPAGVLEGLIPLPPVLTAVISAPIIEECSKFIVVYLVMFMHPEFDEPMDGITYAASVALGFASLENVMYLYNAFKGEGNLTLVMIMRAFLSVPGHALFSSMWGYGLGLAKFADVGQSKEKIIITWLFAGIASHALFNLVCSLNVLATVGLLILVPALWAFVDRRMRQALDSSPHISDAGFRERLAQVRAKLSAAEAQKGWYQSKIALFFLVFLVCFPVGMYGLAKNTSMSWPQKAVWLAIWAVSVLAVGLHGASHP